MISIDGVVLVIKLIADRRSNVSWTTLLSLGSQLRMGKVSKEQFSAGRTEKNSKAGFICSPLPRHGFRLSNNYY